MGRALPRLIALGVSGLLALVGLEGTLRLLRGPESFLPYHRNSVRVIQPSEAVTPGVRGPSRFTTNSFGTRGPEPAGEPVRILTVGGSTTACSTLDDAETWTALLGERLSAGAPGRYWVTSSAIDGHNSDHHLMHALHLLPRLPELDWVLYYLGVNDVGSWLYQSGYDPDHLDDPRVWDHRMGEAFRVSRHTPADWPFYKRLEIWKRASVIKDRALSLRAERAAGGRIVQDDGARWIAEAQREAARRERRFVPRAKMDTLPAALDGYERNLRRIVEATRASGAEPVLMAQALLQHTRQPPVSSRFWLGAMDEGEAQVHREQLVELVDRYNQRTREVAASLGVRFVDVPALLRDETDLFFDGMHFHEHGARVMADALHAELGAELVDRRP